MTRVDGPDLLLAAMLELTVDDLKHGQGEHFYSAARFFKSMGNLPAVCEAHGISYERAAAALREGVPHAGKRRG